MDEIDLKKISELEALLFYYGEPLALKKIAKFLDVKENEVQKLADFLAKKLREDEGSGLIVLSQNKEIQLVTKPEFQQIGKKLITTELHEELSPASLEALSIIAYLGPIVKARVDYLRGVNSAFTLRSLLMRGLIERNMEPEHGNQYHYRVSFDFLKHLGITDPESLPEYEKYRILLQNFEIQG